MKMMQLQKKCFQFVYTGNRLKSMAPVCCVFMRDAPLRCMATSTGKNVERDVTKGSKQLLRQPVPPLSETLTKYLRTVRPFLSSEEYANTEKLVDEFKNDGHKLQKHVEERTSKYENWLADWWLDAAYLKYRNSVVMWSSPGLVFPFQSFNSVADQLTYASNLVAAVLRYKGIIDSGLIKQEYYGEYPLDMRQYSKIFGTCRVPKPDKDELLFEDCNDPSKHIVVAHNNNYFKLTVYDENNNPLTVEDLYDNLLAIVESSLGKLAPVGLLTTDNRDNWSEAYRALAKNKLNVQSLEDIQKSLFLLCLDDKCEISDVNAQTRAALQMIHGGGPNCNGGNRWFDKTVQFVVNCTGEVGLTYEHSPAEGQSIAVMMDFIYNQLSKNTVAVDTTAIRNFKPLYERLSFILTDETTWHIERSRRNLNELVEALEMDCFTYSSYGKSFIKSHKLSPDSFIQMALQYAFYRLHKVAGAQYETASNRMFAGGRTETIRSCSQESVSFAKRMLDSSATKEDKFKALSNAIDSHKNYVVQAMNGFGVDRHLLGLKLAALELGAQVPKLFSDVSYTRSTHFRISTSQVASVCDGFMCYGPLVDDGYACCYNPRDDSINFATAAFRSNRDTDLTAFKSSLISSLDDMHKLLESK